VNGTELLEGIVIFSIFDGRREMSRSTDERLRSDAQSVRVAGLASSPPREIVTPSSAGLIPQVRASPGGTESISARETDVNVMQQSMALMAEQIADLTAILGNLAQRRSAPEVIQVIPSQNIGSRLPITFGLFANSLYKDNGIATFAAQTSNDAIVAPAITRDQRTQMLRLELAGVENVTGEAPNLGRVSGANPTAISQMGPQNPSPPPVDSDQIMRFMRETGMPDEDIEAINPLDIQSVNADNPLDKQSVNPDNPFDNRRFDAHQLVDVPKTFSRKSVDLKTPADAIGVVDSKQLQSMRLFMETLPFGFFNMKNNGAVRNVAPSSFLFLQYEGQRCCT